MIKHKGDVIDKLEKQGKCAVEYTITFWDNTGDYAHINVIEHSKKDAAKTAKKIKKALVFMDIVPPRSHTSIENNN